MIRRMIASMGLAQFGSDHDGLELCCLSAGKQQTLQDSNCYVAEIENARAMPSVPGGTERALRTLVSTALRHRRPQNTAGASSKEPAASAGLPRCAAGKPHAISQAASPGGEQRAAGEERGWPRDCRDAGPCSITHQTAARPRSVHAPERGLISGSSGSLLGTGAFRAGAPVSLSTVQRAPTPSNCLLLDLSEAQK